MRRVCVGVIALPVGPKINPFSRAGVCARVRNRQILRLRVSFVCRKLTVPHPSTILQENFSFSKEATPGLELVDIVTNATRRALKGNLQKPGWKQILTLVIHNRPDYIDFVILASDPMPEDNPPYVEVIKAFRRDGRQMIPKHLIPKARKAAKG